MHKEFTVTFAEDRDEEREARERGVKEDRC